MKKLLLIGCLVLITSCLSPSGGQTATPTPEPSLFPTETLPPSSPTPIPASPTPEPTLTPEPTPTPLPRLFTNDFNSSLAGWVILQAGNESVPAGLHREQCPAPPNGLYLIRGFTLSTVHSIMPTYISKHSTSIVHSLPHLLA